AVRNFTGSASHGSVSAPGGCNRSTELNNGRNLDFPNCPANDANDPNYATTLSGTSIATPHAAALAAYLWCLDPGLSPDQVREALTSSGNCVPVPAGPAGGAAGRERIDAFAAVMDIDRLRGNKNLQRALVDVDDGSHYDGNARLDHDDEDD